MIKAHFENIHIELIRLIESGESDLKICVAWFTDFDIYRKIIEKRKDGMNIEIIVANHEFNKRSRVDFKEFLQLNGKVGYIGKLEGGAKDKFMHHKFCIIDNKTVVTGSYNWSFKARRNDENILVIDEQPHIVEQFTQKFYEIKPQLGFAIQNGNVKLLPIEKIMAKWNLPVVQKKKPATNPVKNITDKF